MIQRLENVPFCVTWMFLVICIAPYFQQVICADDIFSIQMMCFMQFYVHSLIALLQIWNEIFISGYKNVDTFATLNEQQHEMMYRICNSLG